MISREEAERIMGRAPAQPPIVNIYSSALYDWCEDISILNFPNLASAILTEEALFVVHIGFYQNYVYKESEIKEYIEYAKRVKSKILSFLGKRAVLIWMPMDHKKQTLEFLGLDRNYLVLVPTDDSGVELNEDILRMKEEQFYRRLSRYIKYAGLAGESKYGCVSGVKKRCKGLIKTRRIRGLTYW